MPTVNDVYSYLCALAPVELKMDFDNVGLLVGRSEAAVSKILVSLDITHDVISEALDTGSDLIVSHHPLFFSLKSVTDTDITGKKIVRLLSGGISAICMHTNLDAARGGTNDALAAAAGIINIDPETPPAQEGSQIPDGNGFLYGRIGYISEPAALDDYLGMLKKALKTEGLRYYDAGKKVYKVAVVSGSGGSELHHAVKHGCDTFLTSDIKYDVFLEAKEIGINLIDGDHFCTENLVTAALVNRLSAEFPEITVTSSRVHGQTVRFYK